MHRSQETLSAVKQKPGLGIGRCGQGGHLNFKKIHKREEANRPAQKFLPLPARKTAGQVIYSSHRMEKPCRRNLGRAFLEF